MRICRVCEGNCDDDELVGGICHACREEKKQKDMEREMDRLLACQARQTSLFDTEHTAYRGRFGWN